MVFIEGMDLYDYKQAGAEKLEKLTDLQEKLLRHATTNFPRAKRIVYSTCSLLPEENERVVANVMKSSHGRWKVQSVRELLNNEWNNFGPGEPHSIAARCMYAKPESDLTKGFFLAVMDRNSKNGSKSTTSILRDEDNVESKIRKDVRQEKKANIKESKATELAELPNNIQVEEDLTDIQEEEKTESQNDGGELILEENNDGKSIKNVDKMRKKKKRSIDADSHTLNNITDNLSGLLMEEEEIPKKKKKKDKHKKIKENEPDASYAEDISSKSQICGEEITKKKKRKRHIDTNEIAETNQTESDSKLKKKKHKKMDIEVSD